MTVNKLIISDSKMKKCYVNPSYYQVEKQPTNRAVPRVWTTPAAPIPLRRPHQRRRRATPTRRAPAGTLNWTMSLCLAATVLLWLQGASALIAYDCDDGRRSKAVIDLTEPAACPQAESDYADVEKLSMQVVMLNGALRAQGGVCRVYITEKVTRCSWDNKSYGSQTSLPRTLLAVTEEQCREALATRRFTRDGKQFKFTVNTPRSYSYFSHGHVDTDGNCNYVPSLKSGGKTYTWHSKEVVLEILVKNETVKWDPQTGEAKFGNGIRLPDALTTTFDSLKGRLVWNKPPQTQCQDPLVEVYRGPTDFRAHQETSQLLDGAFGVEDRSRSVAVVTGDTHLESTNRLGMYFGKPVIQCGRQCHAIENMPSFIACPYINNKPQFPDVRFRPEAIPRTTLIQFDAKVHSDMQHISAGFRMETRFADLISDACQMEQRQQRLKLAAITGGNPYALAHEFGVGHLVTPAHSVAYLRKCTPITVHQVNMPTGNCTKELPVRKGEPWNAADGASPQDEARPVWYMNTISRTLNRFPSVVPCSKEMPVLWKDDAGDWHSVDPNAHVTAIPQKLTVKSQEYKFDDSFFNDLGAGGLLSPEQFKQTITMEDQERYRLPQIDALTQKRLETAEKGEDGQITMGPIIDAVDLESTRDFTLSYLTPSFLYNLFGPSVLHVFTYVTVLSTGVFLAGVLLRWIYQWTYIGWDGGKVLGHMAMACCGLLELPGNYLKTVFRLGREGTDMATGAVGPLLEVARAYREQMANRRHGSAPNDDVEQGGGDTEMPGSHQNSPPAKDQLQQVNETGSRTDRLRRLGHQVSQAVRRQPGGNGPPVEPLQLQLSPGRPDDSEHQLSTQI